jgi:hypothetical protein
MSTPTTPTEDVHANEGNGSSIMNQQQPQAQSQSQPVVHVPLEEAAAPSDDFITMRNAPESTTSNTSNTNTNNADEIPSPPPQDHPNESAQSQSQSLHAATGMEEESADAQAHDALVSTDSNISMQGGRLWQAAAQEAERRGRTMDSTVLPQSASQEEMEGSGNGNGNPRRNGHPTGGPGSRFAETFMERTRSRADPNALFADPKAKDTTGGTSCCYSSSCFVVEDCITITATIATILLFLRGKRFSHTTLDLFSIYF